jgi:2'-hydroxyisoflavone reductase
MNILIMGGTRFLGHHLVTAALARHHQVTLFNRGTHPPPANVETIHGDRNTDLDKLQGRCWDAVIDTCGFLPPAVKASAGALSGFVDRYVYISSLSVYADVSVPDVDETAPLTTLTDEQLQAAIAIDASGQVSAKTYGDLYGGLKAFCEQAAEAAMPHRVLTLRPGLIVGAHDYTDRLTYWVMRVAQGGEVLAPGYPQRYVQLIDVRDLAEWTVRMIECQAVGIYNANGMSQQLTMERVLEDCKLVSNSDASFTWVSDEFLAQEQVTPWSEVPLWIPEQEAPELKGFMQFNCNKAFAAGLRLRPLKDTIADILTWRKTESLSEPLQAGLQFDKEQALLHQWHATH